MKELSYFNDYLHSSSITWSPFRMKAESTPKSIVLGLPGGPMVTSLPANPGDMGLIPDPAHAMEQLSLCISTTGEGNGNPFQYPCLESLMDRGAWWATVHGLQESDMT